MSFEQLALPIAGLIPQPEPTRIPRTRRVFVNRNLKMAGIDWVGFDMDYTLAIYNQAEMDRLLDPRPPSTSSSAPRLPGAS